MNTNQNTSVYELPDLVEFSESDIVFATKDVAHELTLEYDEFKHAMFERSEERR